MLEHVAREHKQLRNVADNGRNRKQSHNRECPLLIGLMPIFPKHATDAGTFDQTSLSIPIGSGPYVIESADVNRGATLKRNPDYWGRDLPIKRGLDNFDEISVEYYRDASAYFEAFKKGLFDYDAGDGSGRWATGYSFPAARGRPRRARHLRRPAPEGDERLCLQHPPAGLRRPACARGADLLP